MVLGLKTCAGFLNCLRGTSEASALLFVFYPLYGVAYTTHRSRTSPFQCLRFWAPFCRFDDCELEELLQLFIDTSHTHTHTLGYTYTESLFKWRFWVVCACATLAHWRQVATVLQHQLAMGCRGSAWPGLAWGLQIDLNAKNNNELSMWERLSGLHSLSLYRSVSLSLSLFR